LIALLIASTACGNDPTLEVPPGMSLSLAQDGDTSLPQEPKLVILISIDTLRADHLGCYGYQQPTSPAIDAFAKNAVLFEQAVAQAPSTLPSHASMFTSLYPEHHGAFYARQAGLAQGIQTLAGILSENGVSTAAFTGGGQLAPEFGLSRGFDLYDSEPEGPHFTDTVTSALEWLDDHVPTKAFLFLHTYEAHHPYTPQADLLKLFSKDYNGPLPDEISKDLIDEINRGETTIDDKDLAHIIATYDAEIRSVDSGWLALQRGLFERGLLDDALLVFTSDHGEEFSEHGYVGWHSHTLYDELLLVPLVMRFPHRWASGISVPFQVRSIDIAPTVLAALRLEVPAAFEGVSLLPLLAGGAKDPYLAALSQQDTGTDVRFVAVRHRSEKITPRRLQITTAFGTTGFFDKVALHLASAISPFMFFDLEQDPREQNDLARDAKKQIRRLESIDEFVSHSRPLATGSEVGLEIETADRLRALGYVTD